MAPCPCCACFATWHHAAQTSPAGHHCAPPRLFRSCCVQIIKHGGYKISALAIESVLLEHPAIAEVAVVGLSDETYGEVGPAGFVACPFQVSLVDHLVGNCIMATGNLIPCRPAAHSSCSRLEAAAVTGLTQRRRRQWQRRQAHASRTAVLGGGPAACLSAAGRAGGASRHSQECDGQGQQEGASGAAVPSCERRRCLMLVALAPRRPGTRVIGRSPCLLVLSLVLSPISFIYESHIITTVSCLLRAPPPVLLCPHHAVDAVLLALAPALH